MMTNDDKKGLWFWAGVLSGWGLLFFMWLFAHIAVSVGWKP